MSKVKVAAFTVSLDGFGAGSRQDLQNPRLRGSRGGAAFLVCGHGRLCLRK